MYSVKRLADYLDLRVQKRSTSYLILLTVGVSFTFIPFQNCSKVGFSDSGSAPSKNERLQGGGGFDGKVYRSYEQCPDGSMGIGYLLMVAKDKSRAFLVREKCEDLTTHKVVNLEDIHFSKMTAGGLPATLVYLGRAYDEDIPNNLKFGVPPITTPVCWGTTVSASGAPGDEFEFMGLNNSKVILGHLAFGKAVYPDLNIYYSSATSIDLTPPAPGALVTELSVLLPSSSSVPRLKFTIVDAALGSSPVSVDQEVNCGTQYDGSHGLVTFSFTGAPQSFTLPSGASPMVTMKVWGAGGGSGAKNPVGPAVLSPGGAGAFVVAQKLLSDGETLTIEVGGGGAQGNVNGATPAAFGGGGVGRNLVAGVALPFGAGGGGGYSRISSNGTDLVIAGGGGGGGLMGFATGANYSGGNGGAPDSISVQNSLNGLGGRGETLPVAYGSSARKSGLGMGGGGSSAGGGGGGGGYSGGDGGTSATAGWHIGGGGGGSSFAGGPGVINAKFFGGSNTNPAANAPQYPQERLGAGGAGMFLGQSGGDGFVIISW